MGSVYLPDYVMVCIGQHKSTYLPSRSYCWKQPLKLAKWFSNCLRVRAKMRYNGLRPRVARDDLRIREGTLAQRRNSYVRGPSAVSVANRGRVLKERIFLKKVFKRETCNLTTSYGTSPTSARPWLSRHPRWLELALWTTNLCQQFRLAKGFSREGGLSPQREGKMETPEKKSDGVAERMGRAKI